MKYLKYDYIYIIFIFFLIKNEIYKIRFKCMEKDCDCGNCDCRESVVRTRKIKLSGIGYYLSIYIDEPELTRHRIYDIIVDIHFTTVNFNYLYETGKFSELDFWGRLSKIFIKNENTIILQILYSGMSTRCVEMLLVHWDISKKIYSEINSSSILLSKIEHLSDEYIIEYPPLCPTTDSSTLFMDVMSIDIIFDNIIRHLKYRPNILDSYESKNIINLSLTCKELNRLCRQFLLRNYEIDRLYRLFDTHRNSIELYLPICEYNIQNFKILSAILHRYINFYNKPYHKDNRILTILRKIFKMIGNSRKAKINRKFMISNHCLSSSQTIELMKMVKKMRITSNKLYRSIVSKAIISTDLTSIPIVRDLIANQIIVDLVKFNPRMDLLLKTNKIKWKTSNYFLIKQKYVEAINYYKARYFHDSLIPPLLRLLTRKGYYANVIDILYKEYYNIIHISLFPHKTNLVLWSDLISESESDYEEDYNARSYLKYYFRHHVWKQKDTAKYMSFIRSLIQLAKNRLETSNSTTEKKNAGKFIQFLYNHINIIRFGYD